jgi:hypothetical protein
MFPSDRCSRPEVVSGMAGTTAATAGWVIGTVTGVLHLGHRAFLPACLTGALMDFEQPGQLNRIIVQFTVLR